MHTPPHLPTTPHQAHTTIPCTHHLTSPPHTTTHHHTSPCTHYHTISSSHLTKHTPPHHLTMHTPPHTPPYLPTTHHHIMHTSPHNLLLTPTPPQLLTKHTSPHYLLLTTTPSHLLFPFSSTGMALLELCSMRLLEAQTEYTQGNTYLPAFLDGLRDLVEMLKTSESILALDNPDSVGKQLVPIVHRKLHQTQQFLDNVTTQN
ncbi:hypothetical protein Pmani_003099 [Petrolisthes manimaculis]|uniref:Uncharacterized protein n=1 Tax=Petrolisthes manimaculis TaxID=1843537 RepID=A0AAE1QJ78_9EUCA|nr:hypothetical protein Pmani_003099 [Petrolisthes manimaculis]